MTLIRRSCIFNACFFVSICCSPCLSQFLGVNSTRSTRILDTDQQLDAFNFVLNVTSVSAFEAYNLSLEDLATLPPVVATRDAILASDDNRNGTLDGTSKGGMPHYAFFVLMNQMLMNLFQDAHFRVEVDNEIGASDYRYLDLCLAWIQADRSSTAQRTLVNTCPTKDVNIGMFINLGDSLGG